MLGQAAFPLGPLQQLLGSGVAGVLPRCGDGVELPGLEGPKGLLQLRGVLNQLQEGFCRQHQAFHRG